MMMMMMMMLMMVMMMMMVGDVAMKERKCTKSLIARSKNPSSS